jgi:hypothetical protein
MLPQDMSHLRAERDNAWLRTANRTVVVSPDLGAFYSQACAPCKFSKGQCQFSRLQKRDLAGNDSVTGEVSRRCYARIVRILSVSTFQGGHSIQVLLLAIPKEKRSANPKER